MSIRDSDSPPPLPTAQQALEESDPAKRAKMLIAISQHQKARNEFWQRSLAATLDQPAGKLGWVPRPHTTERWRTR